MPLENTATNKAWYHWIYQIPRMLYPFDRSSQSRKIRKGLIVSRDDRRFIEALFYDTIYELTEKIANKDPSFSIDDVLATLFEWQSAIGVKTYISAAAYSDGVLQVKQAYYSHYKAFDKLIDEVKNELIAQPAVAANAFEYDAQHLLKQFFNDELDATEIVGYLNYYRTIFNVAFYIQTIQNIVSYLKHFPTISLRVLSLIRSLSSHLETIKPQPDEDRLLSYAQIYNAKKQSQQEEQSVAASLEMMKSSRSYSLPAVDSSCYVVLIGLLLLPPVAAHKTDDEEVVPSLNIPNSKQLGQEFATHLAASYVTSMAQQKPSEPPALTANKFKQISSPTTGLIADELIRKSGPVSAILIEATSKVQINNEKIAEIKEGALQGDPVYCGFMGLLFEKGLSTPMLELAYGWQMAAAERGLIAAYNALGHLEYERGEFARSFHFYAIAVKYNDGNAAFFLGQIFYLQGQNQVADAFLQFTLKDQPNKKEAISLLNKIRELPGHEPPKDYQRVADDYVEMHLDYELEKFGPDVRKVVNSSGIDWLDKAIQNGAPYGDLALAHYHRERQVMSKEYLKRFYNIVSYSNFYSGAQQYINTAIESRDLGTILIAVHLMERKFNINPADGGKPDYEDYITLLDKLASNLGTDNDKFVTKLATVIVQLKNAGNKQAKDAYLRVKSEPESIIALAIKKHEEMQVPAYAGSRILTIVVGPLIFRTAALIGLFGLYSWLKKRYDYRHYRALNEATFFLGKQWACLSTEKGTYAIVLKDTEGSIQLDHLQYNADKFKRKLKAYLKSIFKGHLIVRGNIVKFKITELVIGKAEMDGCYQQFIHDIKQCEIPGKTESESASGHHSETDAGSSSEDVTPKNESSISEETEVTPKSQAELERERQERELEQQRKQRERAEQMLAKQQRQEALAKKREEEKLKCLQEFQKQRNKNKNKGKSNQKGKGEASEEEREKHRREWKARREREARVRKQKEAEKQARDRREKEMRERKLKEAQEHKERAARARKKKEIMPRAMSIVGVLQRLAEKDDVANQKYTKQNPIVINFIRAQLFRIVLFLQPYSRFRNLLAHAYFKASVDSLINFVNKYCDPNSLVILDFQEIQASELFQQMDHGTPPPPCEDKVKRSPSERFSEIQVQLLFIQQANTVFLGDTDRLDMSDEFKDVDLLPLKGVTLVDSKSKSADRKIYRRILEFHPFELYATIEAFCVIGENINRLNDQGFKLVSPKVWLSRFIKKAANFRNKFSHVIDRLAALEAAQKDSRFFETDDVNMIELNDLIQTVLNDQRALTEFFKAAARSHLSKGKGAKLSTAMLVGAGGVYSSLDPKANEFIPSERTDEAGLSQTSSVVKRC